MTVTLICVVPKGWKEEIENDKASNLFIKTWNEKYPEYKTRLKWNSSRLGRYPSVEIEEDTYWKAFQNDPVFPHGPSIAAQELADILEMEY